MSEEYMKYAISNQAIAVDGVPLKIGFNKLTDHEYSKLSRSKFRGKGIYELHDQELEVQEAQKAQEIDVPKDIVVPEPISPVSHPVKPEDMPYKVLVQFAKERGVNTKGLSKIKVLEALKEVK